MDDQPNKDSMDNGDQQQAQKNKISALDLIKTNFDFIQSQYQEDFEKQELIGYEEALLFMDQFVTRPSKKPQAVVHEIRDSAGELTKEKIIDYSALNAEDNTPLIITGDEGCGKTHAIIHWIMRYNAREELNHQNVEEDIEQEQASQTNVSFSDSCGIKKDQQNNVQSQKTGERERNPNINKNGNVVFSYFAGIESINSRTQLESLKPLRKDEHEKTPQQKQHVQKSNAKKKEENKEEINNDQNKYQSFIYNVMTKIRQVYKVDKRVEILDDQLRTQFRKWLELANQKHKESMDKGTQIVMILDGPENFTDEYGKEQSADWIPNAFPDKFKVLIVCKQNSKAMQHFILRQYPILKLKGLHIEENFQKICEAQEFDINDNPEMYEKFRQYIHFENKSNIITISTNRWKKDRLGALETLNQKSELRKNPTFQTCLILFRDIFDEIRHSKSIYDLFKRILINHYNHKSTLEKQIFLQILIYLTNTRKGLILSELEELLIQKDHFDQKLAKEAIDEFADTFDPVYTFSPITDQLMSQNFQFVQTINFLLFYVNDERQKILDGEIEIKDAVNHRVTHGQKYIVQNICSLIEKQSFSLRQIDELVFQYQKSRKWQRLKDLISSIEVFSILYNPETKHQLAGYWQLLEQFKYDPVAEYNKSLEGFVQRYSPNNEEMFVILLQLSRFLRELADFETKSTPQFKHPTLHSNLELEQITLLAELERLGFDIYNDSDEKQAARTKQKAVNLDNPITREVFKQNLIKELKENNGGILNLEYRPVKDVMAQQEQGEQRMINYYYKRWLWVQFPWMCINVFQNVSEIMELSVSLSNLRPELLEKMSIEEQATFEQYFSIDQENELVLKSLNILKDAKLRRQGDSSGNKTTEKITIPSRKGPMKKIQPTIKQQVQLIKAKERQQILDTNNDVFARNALKMKKHKINEDSVKESLIHKKDLKSVFESKVYNPMATIKKKNTKEKLLPPKHPSTPAYKHQDTFTSQMKQQIQSEKALHLRRSNSAIKQLLKNDAQLEEPDNAAGEQKLFFDIRKQIFKNRKNFSQLTKNSADQVLPENNLMEDRYISDQQKAKNEALQPELVLNTLNYRMIQKKQQKVVELLKSNNQLQKILNQKNFEFKRLEEEKYRAYKEYIRLSNTNKGGENSVVTVKECQALEAKLLAYHEKFNHEKVAKKRMDQIISVLAKNPATHTAFTGKLQNTAIYIRQLTSFEAQGTIDAKKHTDQYVEEINHVMKQMEDKMHLRERIHKEFALFLKRMSNDSTTNENQRKQLTVKLKGLREKKSDSIKEQLNSDLKQMAQFSTGVMQKPASKLKISKKSDPVDQAGKGINQKDEDEALEKRLQHFRQWTIKLKVSLAFLREKNVFFSSEFEKVSKVTNIQNPNDIESLTGILTRTKELARTKKQKEEAVQKLKARQDDLTEKIQDFYSNIDLLGGDQNKDQRLSTLQQQLYESQNKLKEAKNRYQKQTTTIAQAKSGISYMARSLGQINLKGAPKKINLNDGDNIKKLTDRLMVKYIQLQMNIQQRAENKKKETEVNQEEQDGEADSHAMMDFAFMSPDKKSGQVIGMERNQMKEVINDQSARVDVLGLAAHMQDLEDKHFQEALAEKKKKNIKEKRDKAEEEAQKQIYKQMKKNKALGGTAQAGSSQGLERQKTQKFDQTEYNQLTMSRKRLPKFKQGVEIGPIIANIRQRIKNEQPNAQLQELYRSTQQKFEKETLATQVTGGSANFNAGMTTGGLGNVTQQSQSMPQMNQTITTPSPPKTFFISAVNSKLPKTIYKNSKADKLQIKLQKVKDLEPENNNQAAGTTPAKILNLDDSEPSDSEFEELDDLMKQRKKMKVAQAIRESNQHLESNQNKGN